MQVLALVIIGLCDPGHRSLKRVRLWEPSKAGGWNSSHPQEGLLPQRCLRCVQRPGHVPSTHPGLGPL